MPRATWWTACRVVLFGIWLAVAVCAQSSPATSTQTAASKMPGADTTPAKSSSTTKQIKSTPLSLRSAPKCTAPYRTGELVHIVLTHVVAVRRHLVLYSVARGDHLDNDHQQRGPRGSGGRAAAPEDQLPLRAAFLRGARHRSAHRRCSSPSLTSCTFSSSLSSTLRLHRSSASVSSCPVRVFFVCCSRGEDQKFLALNRRSSSILVIDAWRSRSYVRWPSLIAALARASEARARGRMHSMHALPPRSVCGRKSSASDTSGLNLLQPPLWQAEALVSLSKDLQFSVAPRSDDCCRTLSSHSIIPPLPPEPQRIIKSKFIFTAGKGECSLEMCPLLFTPL